MAAYSDGHIDASERSRMMDKVAEMALEPDEKAVLFDALSSPLSLADLCRIVDCPELAAEVYLCSLLVLDKSLIHSSIYLDALAQRLEIPPDFTKQLHTNIEQESTQAADRRSRPVDTVAPLAVAANTDSDEATLQQLVTEEPIGHTGHVRVQDGINILEL
jgi:hypothetical protein